MRNLFNDQCQTKYRWGQYIGLLIKRRLFLTQKREEMKRLLSVLAFIGTLPVAIAQNNYVSTSPAAAAPGADNTLVGYWSGKF